MYTRYINDNVKRNFMWKNIASFEIVKYKSINCTGTNSYRPFRVHRYGIIIFFKKQRRRTLFVKNLCRI